MSRVISADCHINEPPTVFDRVPQACATGAPKMMRGADGGDGWSFDGKHAEADVRRRGDRRPRQGRQGVRAALRRDPARQLRRRPRTSPTWTSTASTSASSTRGARSSPTWSPTASSRSRACAPTTTGSWTTSRARDPTRIVGLPMIPVDDGLDVAHRRARAIGRPRARGPASSPGSRPSRTTTPPTTRSGLRRGGTASRSRSTAPSAAARPKPTATSWSTRTSPSRAPPGASSARSSRSRTWPSAAMFERHPGLRIVAAEVNMAWVPFWAQTVDQQFDNDWYQATGAVTIPRPPERVPGREPLRHGARRRHRLPHDRRGARAASGRRRHVLDRLPAQRLPLAELARAHREADRRALTAVDKEKILSGNAARVYGI